MGRGRWKVGEIAERARVSVRTLHHYDEIGLVVPSDRTVSGYRLYSESDVERLYQVLLYRELGFALERIARLLDAPSPDRLAALREQRERLLAQKRRTDGVIQAVNRMVESMEKGEKMGDGEIEEGFDAFAAAPREVRAHQAKHGEEVRERWGGTEPYRESMRRTRDYTEANWRTLRAESESNESRMAELMARGSDPEGADAMACAEAMREHIGRWFYPCSHRMHAGLADMYEADPRFAAHYDSRAAGLSVFVAAAVRANAIRAWDGGES